MPDTLIIPKQVTISGDVLYRAMRDVVEARELFGAFTAWVDIPLTDKLEGAVQALGEALMGVSGAELFPLGRSNYTARLMRP
jgi:hypothetical protein